MLRTKTVEGIDISPGMGWTMRSIYHCLTANHVSQYNGNTLAELYQNGLIVLDKKRFLLLTPKGTGIYEKWEREIELDDN